MKRDDDRRLDVGREERHEAERIHAADERLAVGGVAREPRRLAALFGVLSQSRVERHHDVRWRRIAPLRSAFHVRPLIVQVERK